MEQLQIELDNLQISQVPWHRLTTPYGRATEFPKLFAQFSGNDLAAVESAGKKLCTNIEHQSSLWPCTPFAAAILLPVLERSVETMDDAVSFVRVKLLLNLFDDIAYAYRMAEDMEWPAALPHFCDMLQEQYLWSEEYDEAADSLRYEEEDPFPAVLAASFYLYAFRMVGQCRPLLDTIHHPGLQKRVNALKEKL